MAHAFQSTKDVEAATRDLLVKHVGVTINDLGYLRTGEGWIAYTGFDTQAHTDAHTLAKYVTGHLKGFSALVEWDADLGWSITASR